MPFRLSQTDLFEADAEPAPPYSVSASIYDHMMREVDYRGWAKYILLLMKVAGKKQVRSRAADEKVCELACGTGNISLILSKLGYDVTGVDNSEEMLKVAEKKLARRRRAKLHLIHHDMVTYVSGERFDRAVCVYDSINYLSPASAMGRFFSNVYESLKPGGVFVFDLSLESNSLNDSSLFVQRGEYKGIYYHRKSLYDPKSKIHTTQVRVRSDGCVMEETHKEYVYPLNTVRKLFRAAGFEERFAAGDFTMLEADGKSERVHFVLVKPSHD